MYRFIVALRKKNCQTGGTDKNLLKLNLTRQLCSLSGNWVVSTVSYSEIDGNLLPGHIIPIAGQEQF